jgi:TPR repeat protein
MTSLCTTLSVLCTLRTQISQSINNFTHYRKRDNDLAVYHFQIAGERNHTGSLNGLGVFYMNAEGAARNDTKALMYFEKSARLRYVVHL